MKAQKNGNVVFELKGESLAAALALEIEIRRELKTVTPVNTGPLNEIQDSWQRMYDGLTLRLRKESPEILERTGLEAPSRQVFQGKGTLPRAYIEYPQIFSSPEKTPRYFMYAPVDYRGNYFTPPEAVMLDAKTRARVDDLLFAGGWLGNAPLVSRKKYGVETPADYNSVSAKFRNDGHKQVCFIAGGDSLAAVADFDRRTEDWKAKIDILRGEIEKTVTAQFPEIMQNLPPAEGLRASVSYRYGGGETTVEMLLSVRREGKLSIWDAGKTVPLPENNAYMLEKSEGGDYTVLPRRDTAEGRALAELFDAVPPTPYLAEYDILRGNFDFKPGQFDEMLGVNGVVPQARKFEGMVILVYNADDNAGSDFHPAGATPLPAAVYQWLQSDLGDRNMGVIAPPMPKIVEDVLLAVKAANTVAKKPDAPKL